MLGYLFLKKILGIIALSLLWCNLSIAQIIVVEKKTFSDVTYETVCIDGYKFITTQDIDFESRGAGNTRSVSISTSVNTIQFMIVENGKMIPAKCK